MTMVTMTLMMMSYGVKRLENLILAASPDVPAKAELSLCQLLTEAICNVFVLQSLTLCFAVCTVCGTTCSISH